MENLEYSNPRCMLGETFQVVRGFGVTRRAQTCRRRRRAVTLNELLSVVSLIALLIGVLVPALATARTSIRSMVCQTNLRQWAVGTALYAQTHQGYLPHRGQGVQPTNILNRPEDWFNALPPLLGSPTYFDLTEAGRIPRPGAKSIWMCPQAEAATPGPYFAYGMNMLLSTWNAPRRTGLMKFPAPRCRS